MNLFRLKSLLILILSLIAVTTQVFADRPSYSKDWREFAKAPADSLQESQLQIWIPNESKQAYYFKIDIFDKDGQVIRHFIKDNLKPGYINVYWDKKNDSGLWVQPGVYNYLLTIQTKEKRGELTATFTPEELLVQVYPEQSNNPGIIRYDILGDSVLVTIGVYKSYGRLEFSVMKDSLCNQGSYQFEWTITEKTRKGDYNFRLKAAGVTHKTKISRVVNEKK